MSAVEQLDYVVTVGDVASRAGLEINQTQQGLLTLASEAGGHLQVSDTGEMVFEFPRQFRSILRNKFWRLRLQSWAKTLWQGIFYLIRISFGILLVLSIVLMLVAIAAIVIAVNSKSDSDSDGGFNFGGDRRGGGGFFFFPTDIFWLFSPDPYRPQQRHSKPKEKGLNFLEAIFSFLFGDGDPNADLEEKRWRTIGTLIRNNGGAIAAEQVAPYLDNVTPLNQETEDYIMPVLARFNGYPQVSDQGDIIYTFPDLQVSAQRRAPKSVANFLREKPWKFSQASSGQIIAAIALGGVNLVLALTLGSLLTTYDVDLGLIQFVQGVYGLLVAYAVGFLGIPLGRYFWLQRRNQKLEHRNEKRQDRAKLLQPPSPAVKAKLDFAQEWTASKVISAEDITYRTDQDLHEQEALRSDQIDEEWRRRLESGS
ncbi:MAG: hypothetical protein ACO36E_00790 [Synechocystis sp.]